MWSYRQDKSADRGLEPERLVEEEDAEAQGPQHTVTLALLVQVEDRGLLRRLDGRPQLRQPPAGFRL
jgi:hypothetical protein